MHATVVPPVIIETLPVGILSCNCTILGDPASGTAVVIDPGGDADEIMAVLERTKLRPVALVHTHAHLDHLYATKELADRTGAPVFFHEADRFLVETVRTQAESFGLPVPEEPPIQRRLCEDPIPKLGALAVECIHTPGHTPGSVTLSIRPDGDGPRHLFTGDTLFLGSIGRTDLWGGDPDLILESIRTRLLTLEDATRVTPGHGAGTTIGFERKRNPFLQDL